MPAFVVGKKGEKKWKKSKKVAEAIEREHPKKGSNKYALANWLFHHKKFKKSDPLDQSLQAVTVMPGTVYEYLGKTGKKIKVQVFDDMALARDHLQGLKKLYGKYVKAGIEKRKVSAYDNMMNRVKRTQEKRKTALEIDQ